MVSESGIAPLPGVEAAADWVMRLTRMQRECHRHSGLSMPRRGDGVAQSGYARGAMGDARDVGRGRSHISEARPIRQAQGRLWGTRLGGGSVPEGLVSLVVAGERIARQPCLASEVAGVFRVRAAHGSAKGYQKRSAAAGSDDFRVERWIL